jgi:hypothetical protein
MMVIAVRFREEAIGDVLMFSKFLGVAKLLLIL